MNTTPQRRIDALVEDVSRIVRRALLDANTGHGGADAVALTLPPAPEPIAPVLLARAHPGDTAARQQACALYERCLAHYRSALRADDPSDDVGAALARFVAANLEALCGVHATPAMLLRLERQLGGVLRLSAAWLAASLRERQQYFEEIAIVSVLIGESWPQAVLQGPAAVGNVRRAARGYLRQLLGLEPGHLTLGADGLSLLPIEQPGVAQPA